MRGASARVSASLRLDRQPGEVLDRSQAFTFSWNGTTYPAYHGDTIVSALAACGERVFSRSFKYHRPRGVLTATSLDPGCLVQLADEPNVRGCQRPVEPGMQVWPQNAWPTLRVDVKAAIGLLDRFLPAGFYYKTFIKPRRLWPWYERVLQRFAAGGSAPVSPPGDYCDKRYAHPDVVVAGGGPAGMAAAQAAAEAGAQVMLVEEERDLGGQLRYGNDAERALLADLRTALTASEGVEVLTDSVVSGRYDDNWVAIVQRGHPGVRERLIKARAKSLVVAAGLIERPYVFAGNDVPGVMLSTAARRLINLYAVKPGHRAVVLTANPEGDVAVADLKRAGVEVARVEDARLGGDLVRVHGRRGVRAVEVADGSTLDCDLVVTATGWTAPTSLLNMAGDQPRYRPEAARFVPEPARLAPGVLATGGIVGDASLEQHIAHGRAVGREAARHARQVGRARRRGLPQLRAAATTPAGDDAEQAEALPELRPEPHPALFRGRTHGLVDFSEDVSSKDLVAAVREGYASVELVKRYTTATMGPAQGKLETVNAVAIIAEATGKTIGAVGTTVWRPPYQPVTLGTLAGRTHEPVRYSPMQPWHERHGARPLVAGAWIRPDHYGDPAAEVRCVRERVGLIDITPIGKLDLRGPDVPRLLNLLYTNKWSQLPVGRVRYGLMCAEDGVVLDDGVTGRLGEDQYLMSTTSAGAATVWEWVERWLQTEHPGWQVHVTPVTTAYASMNLAGPRSRELLQRLCDGVELSNDAFPYLHVRQARVAGVDGCVMWRIGFTGELSYELHVPAGYGLHVWETLLRAGRDLGIGVFGVEAQRIMRLEKGHLIVGQDTDGLTRAWSAGIDWALKLDKDDFAGKPELVWQRDDGISWRLVGLQPHDGALVPAESSQIVEGAATVVGRVTSSRMSPTLGRAICLGFVAARLAVPGTSVTVLLPDGRRVGARVLEGPCHVDPAGERLRA